MRTYLRGKITLLFMMLGMLLAIPAVALAAELVTSELDTTTPNEVTVTQGGSTSFNIGLRATGAISNLITETNASIATVDTEYSLDSAGTFTKNTPSSGSKFFSSGDNPTGNNSTVTWTGAPDPYSVGATISAAATTPTGDYTLSLSPTAGDTSVSNPSSVSGGKLDDTTASTITVHVVAPPPPSDTTPPVITKVVTGTLGNNGWYTSDVAVDWTVSDAQSTISSQSGCDDFSVTSDQNAQTYTCTATSAGGTSNQSVTIKRDATAPTNVAFVDGPAAGGSYDPDSVPAAPTCTADGAISGLASCNVTGYSANAGEHTMTATATDNAGNEATANRSYSVLGWDLKGFYQPVDMGMTNTAKAGQTVPLKFEMFEKVSGDERTNVSDVKTFTQKVTCGSFEPSEDAIEQYSSGGTSLRYDTTGGQFIFNWQTPKAAGSCFKVTMTPNDTSSNAIEAHFKLK
jgi:hypothetical protein